MKRLATAVVGLLLVGAPALAEPLKPLPYIDASAAPKLTNTVKVRFTTDAGEFVLEVYPQAAPNAAARFLDLVKGGFYDQTPVFRVVPNFVAQFGINWRNDFPQWKNRNFDDDPSIFALEPYTIAFAKAGKNTNSSQVFINYKDNSHLAGQGAFTAFGKVVSGQQVLPQFRAVGDPRGGLDQEKLWVQGEAYLRTLPKKPNMILKAEILP